MGLPKPIPESQRCRARALECRAVAGRLRVDFARTQMLKTAADFDRAARDAREREIVHGIAELGVLVHKVHRTE
jgi:purine nucleoside permease